MGIDKHKCQDEEQSVSSRITLFNQHVQQHLDSQQINPFTQRSVSEMAKLRFTKEQYGHAPPGSRSERRAQLIKILLLEETLKLCQLINAKGVCKDAGLPYLSFGELFELYNNISDKLVGLLRQARRSCYLDFPGEMLFQKRDDAVLVQLKRPYNELILEIQEKIENLKRKHIKN